MEDLETGFGFEELRSIPSMSGIEIAGLVLGAIPLVIAALEHYESLIGPMLAYKHYQGELAAAIISLTSQHALFQQNIEILLRPITMDNQLVDMLDNAGSSFWQDPKIRDALEQHLGRAYQAYMRKITEIQDLIKAIFQKLENVPGVDRLDAEGLEALIKVNTPGPKNQSLQKFTFPKRIKFTMSRKSIKRLMKQLRQSIGDLSAFQDNATRLAMADVSRERRSKYRYLQPIDTVRQYTLRLFNGLSGAWCSLHPSHTMGLLLERRRWLKNLKRGANPCTSSDSEVSESGRSFNVRLGIVTISGSTDWKAANIQILEKFESQVKLG